MPGMAPGLATPVTAVFSSASHSSRLTGPTSQGCSALNTSVDSPHHHHTAFSIDRVREYEKQECGQEDKILIHSAGS